MVVRRSGGDGLRLLLTLDGRAVVLVAAAATPATAPAAGALGLIVAVALGGRGSLDDLGLLGGLIHLGGTGLALEDRVHELGLAQTAEAVHTELVGEQVQVGQRALLQSGAIQDGRHYGLLEQSVGVRPR